MLGYLKSTLIIFGDQQPYKILAINMNEPQNTFEADGTRPIENTDLEIADTFEEDGTRPIAESPDFLLSDRQPVDTNSTKDTSKSTGNKINSSTKENLRSDRAAEAKPHQGGKIRSHRPVDNNELNIVDTLEVDGERPITQGSRKTVDNINIDGQRPIVSSSLDADHTLDIDGKRPIDNSNIEVVDSFEADGERPIMANKYDVVDTLDIDGERPITSENN